MVCRGERVKDSSDSPSRLPLRQALWDKSGWLVVRLLFPKATIECFFPRTRQGDDCVFARSCRLRIVYLEYEVCPL